MFKLFFILVICIECAAIGYLWGKTTKPAQIVKSDCGACYDDLIDDTNQNLVATVCGK